MKYYSFTFLLLLGGLFFSACTDSPAPQTDEPGAEQPTLSHSKSSFEKNAGPCGSDGVDLCASVSMDYPVFEGGDAADAMNRSIYAMLSGILNNVAPSGTEDEAPNLEAVGEVFGNDYLEFIEESADFATSWEVETQGDVMLQNEKITVVSLGTYTYTGGAHPNARTDIFVFDNNNGKRIGWDELIIDKAGLEQLAQNAFRSAREAYESEVAYEESDYFWGGPFKLPENFGFNEQGLYMIYNAYEAAPYVFGPTDFTLPYTDLNQVLNLGIVQ